MSSTSPDFINSKQSTSHTFAARKKRPPPSQGFSSMNWCKKHESLRCCQKYGGPKRYTMQQVSEHSTRDDCWMILNGHFFDITEYIPFHPGGDEILKAKGKDGTALFYKFHRWVNIEALLKNCWLGQVIDYKPPKMNEKKKKNNAKNANNPNDKNRKEAMSRTQKLIQNRLKSQLNGIANKKQ